MSSQVFLLKRIAACVCAVLFAIAAQTTYAKPFEIHVLDADTGRGIPLVELETVNLLRFVTDSAGRVAFEEPGLMDTRVFFSVKSHGYQTPDAGFGAKGVVLEVKDGGKAVVKLKRNNIAERLYRVTGGGIYADSVKLGYETPLEKPVINGLVLGQDSVQPCIYKDTLYLFWGDTNRPAHPLGLFQMSGATALLPEQGGLSPDVGVNLKYFVGQDGFSRAMAPLKEPGVVWIDGVLAVKDAEGTERMVCHYSRRKGLAGEYEHGLMLWNDEKELFERIKILEGKTNWRHPRGQPTRVTNDDGDYFYFTFPFATTRVKATYEAVTNPAEYEALAAVEESAQTKIRWQRFVKPLEQKPETQLMIYGKVALKDTRLQLVDAVSDKQVIMHNGTVRWNAYRNRWILIGVQIEGESSFLGEVWYAESDQIDGPWTKGVKIATHDKYSFYNPVQHHFLDREGGRYVYFEGTYVHTFSGNEKPTPRYDYNQVMYRLDLADPRLKAAQTK
jgi:hypothetical protein